MSRLRLLCTAAVLTLAANANASSLIMTTDSIVGALKATSDATSDATSSLRDNKVVQAARDDAASFVASEGAIRGVKLEAPWPRSANKRHSSIPQPMHSWHRPSWLSDPRQPDGSARRSRMARRWLSPGRCASLGARFQLSSPMAFHTVY